MDVMDRELSGCEFKDGRRGKRFRRLLRQLADGTAEDIPAPLLVLGHYQCSISASLQTSSSPSMTFSPAASVPPEGVSPARASCTLGEPGRCVNVGDREADTYELSCTGNDVGTYFVICRAYPCVAAEGATKSDTEMQAVRFNWLHRLAMRDERGAEIEAVIEVRYRWMLVLASVAKQKDCDSLKLTAIHAEYRGSKQGRVCIDWKLLIDLPVRCRADVIERLQWHALRRKIGIFHARLKSDCRAELCRLRTAPPVADAA